MMDTMDTSVSRDRHVLVYLRGLVDISATGEVCIDGDDQKHSFVAAATHSLPLADVLVVLRPVASRCVPLHRPPPVSAAQHVGSSNSLTNNLSDLNQQRKMYVQEEEDLSYRRQRSHNVHSMPPNPPP